MEQMTDAMKQVAGSRMKGMLARLTTSRPRAVLTGAVVTATVQSSSVTTVLLVGFVSAGLMTLPQTIGVIMGAEIGTTVTAQLIAFKVTRYALVGVIIGFLMQFLGGRKEIKQYGLVIMGLGFVFYGMDVMGQATHPLRTHEPFIALMQSMETPLLGILLSAAFTALIQSSSATTGIIIVLASQGFITLQAGIALIFGANIGTCITALLAAIGKPREAVRTALVHVSFNVAGVLVWYHFIPQLAALVTWVSPGAEELSGMARLAAETPRQIANAHTAFNVANTLLFIGFTPAIAWWVRKLVPDRPATHEPGARARFLDDLLLDTPSLALDRVRMEIGRVAERVVEMVHAAPPALIHHRGEELDHVEAMDDDVDSLYADIVAYLGQLTRVGMKPADTRTLQAYLSVVNYLEAIADLIETNMVQAAREAQAEEVAVSEGTLDLLGALHEKTFWAVEKAASAVHAGHPGAAQEVIDAKGRIASLVEAAEARVADRLASDAPNRLATFRLESDVIESLKRIYYFAKRIAKAVLEQGLAGNETAPGTTRTRERLETAAY
ncbi:MAG: Na/Pi cotransporter family protein [Gemmatimonadetes bacterium]|nr:Na/Pi cotransporter family protein [Gemmatimonadota bacterium]